MKLKAAIASLSILLVSPWASASDYVEVPDMSQLSYQIFQNRVNIRNMSAFAPSWQGCCEKYYVDLGTEEGKAMWATMLAKILAGQSLWIGVEDKNAAQSKITFIGNW